MSPDDDVGFLEQLYFPIRFSFSDTTLLHKQWSEFFLEILLKVKRKNAGMTIHRAMFALNEWPQGLKRIPSWYIAQLNKAFQHFVLTNASNVSKGQRNFGILVTSQCLEWIPIMLQCALLHCYIAQLNKDIEQFCVDSLVKYFIREGCTKKTRKKCGLLPNWGGAGSRMVIKCQTAILEKYFFS